MLIMSNIFHLIFINSITTSFITLAISYFYNYKEQNDKIDLLNKKIVILKERMKDLNMYIEDLEDKIDKKHTQILETNSELYNKLDNFIISNYDICD